MVCSTLPVARAAAIPCLCMLPRCSSVGVQSGPSHSNNSISFPSANPLSANPLIQIQWHRSLPGDCGYRRHLDSWWRSGPRRNATNRTPPKTPGTLSPKIARSVLSMNRTARLIGTQAVIFLRFVPGLQGLQPVLRWPLSCRDKLAASVPDAVIGFYVEIHEDDCRPQLHRGKQDFWRQFWN